MSEHRFILGRSLSRPEQRTRKLHPIVTIGLLITLFFFTNVETTLSQCSTNQQFETADFTGWATLGQSNNTSVSCSPFRYSDDFNLLSIDDSCFALHSFNSTESGTVANCYSCTFSNCDASLNFDYALSYDTRGLAAIDDLFEVTIIDSQGNLVTILNESAAANTLEPGNSDQLGTVDLTQYNCQNIQLCFTTTVPATMTGEVAVAFDNVNLSDNVCSTQSLLCLGAINLSLNENCIAEVTPEMLFPSTVADPSQYEIRLTDSHGNEINGTTVDLSDLNTTVQYEVSNLTAGCNKNACWGNINVEYKFQPTFNGCQDLTISCAEIDVLPPATVSGGSDCIAQTFTINLTNESITDISECDSPYTNEIIRTYQATDGNGNTATCNQRILLQRVDFSSLQYPQGTTTINCSDLDSYFTYELDGQVIPIPWVPSDFDIADIGVPYLDGGALTGSGTGSGTGIMTGSGSGTTPFPTGSGTGSGTIIPLIPFGNPNDPDGPDAFFLSDDAPVPIEAQRLCNTFVTYTDLLYPQIGCSTKLVRTWEVLEWTCGQEISQNPFSHIIEIIDDVAPEFVCPSNMTISSDNDCGSAARIPGVQASDACLNGVNVRAFTPLGVFSMDGSVDDGIEVNLIHGLNEVTYEISDDCGNRETCTVDITLQDGIQPVAICEQTTVVSMGSTGQTLVSSNTFDDGSWDECSAITTCAVRMSDLLLYRSLSVDTIVNGVEYVLMTNYKVACPFSNLTGTIIDGVAYLSDDDLCSPYVQFCCMDMGGEEMVVFRAIDAGGNSSDCMVRVEVQGFAPQLTCPASLTVDCMTDIASLDTGNVGVTGDCQDLGTMITTFNNTNLNVCGLGTVIKTFSLQTSTEVLATCDQQIIVENQSPVDANIVWPADMLNISGICSVAQLSPTALNSMPMIPSSGTCSQLGFDFDDVVSGQSGCLSITRTWTVIDWCSRSAEGTFKTYEHIQEISTIGNAMTMVTASSPLTFETASLDCQRNLTVSASATSGCTNSLAWSYSLVNVDQNAVVAIGSDYTFTGVLPVGEYRMQWTASDGCNAPGSFNQIFFVESTKAPKPVCLTNYTVTVGAGETATIYPSDINAGSSHQCYPTSDLILSFSEDGMQNSITHLCGSSLTQPVSLWVMLDPADDVTRKGSCVTTLTVDCGTSVQGNMVTVSGRVQTEDFQIVEQVSIDMGPVMGQEQTDNQGLYAFEPMPVGGSYQVVPGKDVDYLNGVSTLDLVLIQRHILDIERLDSPYKLLAADVNSSKSIDGLDLIELRKLILGIYDDLPDNTSWRFFDETKYFSDEANPWSSTLFESYTISSLVSDMNIDFIGVKIGDVDNSFVANLNDANINLRSQRWPLVLKMDEVSLSEGQIQTIEVTASNYERISGFQGTLSYDESLVEIIDVRSAAVSISDYNVHHTEGAMSFSIFNKNVQGFDPDVILFEIDIMAKGRFSTSSFEINSDVTAAEAYRGYNEEVPLYLESNESSETNKILTANPNPFIHYTDIEFVLSEGGEVEFQFYDTQGKLLYSESGYYDAGKGRVQIAGEDLDVRGLIYIKMVTSDNVNDFKMIRL